MMDIVDLSRMHSSRRVHTIGKICRLFSAITTAAISEVANAISKKPCFE